MVWGGGFVLFCWEGACCGGGVLGVLFVGCFFCLLVFRPYCPVNNYSLSEKHNETNLKVAK